MNHINEVLQGKGRLAMVKIIPHNITAIPQSALIKNTSRLNRAGGPECRSHQILNFGQCPENARRRFTGEHGAWFVLAGGHP